MQKQAKKLTKIILRLFQRKILFKKLDITDLMVEHQNQVLKMNPLLGKFYKEKLKFLKRQKLEVHHHHLQALLILDHHLQERVDQVHLLTGEIALHHVEEMHEQLPSSEIVGLQLMIV